jgi:hypothetical protein
MEPSGMKVVILSDSIFCNGETSRTTPAFLMMDRVDVNAVNFAAGGMPLGRLNVAPGQPIAMCDQKVGLNYLNGFAGDIDCLIVFGGVNDWMYGTANVLQSVFFGAVELGYYAHQIGIPNIVFVSPLIVRGDNYPTLDPENDPNNVEQLSDIRSGIEIAVAGLANEGINAVYIHGPDLMPNDAENYQLDGLHPSATGRGVWLNNLIDQLQTLSIFPADYV